MILGIINLVFVIIIISIMYFEYKYDKVSLRTVIIISACLVVDAFCTIVQYRHDDLQRSREVVIYQAGVKEGENRRKDSVLTRMDSTIYRLEQFRKSLNSTP